MIVNGVDISMLEGWMIKINSNPSFFGKNMSRRWFKVGYAASGGTDQAHSKLIISYSTNKTSKEPRGWLYVEDVSGVYCRRDMIEIVSPARTLRLKGETTAEHRLWSDSLYRLCNPTPPPTSASSIKPSSSQSAGSAMKASTTSMPEAKREECRREERHTTLPVEAKTTAEPKPSPRPAESSGRSQSAKALPREDPPGRRPRNEKEDDDDDRLSSEDSDSDDGRTSSRRRKDISPRPRSGRQEREEPINVRHDSERHRRRRTSESRASSRHDSDRHDESDLDSDDDRDAKRGRERASSVDSDNSDTDNNKYRRQVEPPLLNKRPSLLVAQIKAAAPTTVTTAPAVAAPQSPKFSEDEDDETGSPKRFGSPRSVPKLIPQQQKLQQATETDNPQEETPRDDDNASSTPSLSPIHETRPVPAEQDEITAKRSGGDYFDSDEEEVEHVRKTPTSISIEKVVSAPKSEVARDNNFVDDDWDAEDEAPRKAPPAKHHAKAPVSIGVGNVAADSNFVTEDWDN